jgi:flagellar P-ring protein precursor FlgI
VTVRAPASTGMAHFLSLVENLPVAVDAPAKVVIDEVNGVIVMGEAVRVSTVAVAQGNLTVSVQETPLVSQPEPFSRGGETVVVPQSDITIEEERGRQMRIIGGGASLSTVVDGLNALGVSPRDMISILQAIRTAGALQAEIEVM